MSRYLLIVVVVGTAVLCLGWLCFAGPPPTMLAGAIEFRPLDTGGTAPDVSPELTYRHPPDYPPRAFHDCVKGVTEVEALVDKSGYVIQTRAKNSSGDRSLDVAAQASMYRCDFKPAESKGQAVTSWTTCQVEFTRDCDTAKSPYQLDPATSENEDYLPGPDEFVKLDTAPEMIHEHPPIYPRHAEYDNVEGAVRIRALVDKEGCVLAAEIDRSSGFTSLDETALAAAYMCEYEPGMIKQKPVACWVNYPVNFTLESSTEGAVVDTSDEDYLPKPDEFVAVETYPEMIYEHKPDYPRLAKQVGMTGTVWVKALVDERGDVIKAQVAKSSGTTSLDEAAVEAAYKNKFTPASQNGEPVAVWVQYKVDFVLPTRH